MLVLLHFIVWACVDVVLGGTSAGVVATARGSGDRDME